MKPLSMFSDISLHDFGSQASFPDPEAFGQTRKDIPFLVTYINLNSYLLFFPFRIVYSKQEERFVLSTSIIRKVIIAIHI